jgi:hypothetical protein
VIVDYNRPLRAHRWVLTFVAAALLSLPACRDRSAPPAEQGKPASAASPQAAGDQPVNADAKALAGLMERVNEYIALHRKLEGSLPHLSKEATPEEIDKHQRSLGKMIQDARAAAKQGDLFTPESQAVVKRLLARVFGGPDGQALKASIMDENPGIPTLKVNERYPDTVPLSTIPPQVLEGLPKLPDEMEFRFVGNSLILMDVHAHIIADFIPNAFPH